MSYYYSMDKVTSQLTKKQSLICKRTFIARILTVVHTNGEHEALVQSLQLHIVPVALQ